MEDVEVDMTSSALKLERAKEHFHSFAHELRRFYESEPWALVPAPEGDDLVLRVARVRPIPPRLALIAGDLVHNARSALDCVVVELAGRGEGEVGRAPTSAEERTLSFPVTRSEHEFVQKMPLLCRFLPDAALGVMMVVQPWYSAALDAENAYCDYGDDELRYRMSFSLLHRLATLSNADKHRRLSLMLFRPSSVTDDSQNRRTIPLETMDRLQGIEWLGIPEPEPVHLDLSDVVVEEPADPGYDFHFGIDELVEGAEMGRYVRYDGGGPMPMIPVRATLRVVLVEPGLTDVRYGGPHAERVLAELIDQVGVVLDVLGTACSGAAEP